MDSSTSQDRSEIVFFDLETRESSTGQRYQLVEFGAILICPRKLVELGHYSTLVRPSNLSAVWFSGKPNGITRGAVASAPFFREVAATVYDILNGRVWAGHNILGFDCDCIREAFAEIGRPAPEPKGTIDTLTLLRKRFGYRAGDMKMATLATYFGLGEQSHRSLDDARMNLEVVRYCSAVLFWESSLQEPNSSSLHTPLEFEDGQGIFPITAGTEAEITHLVDCNMAKPDPPIDLIEEASQPVAKMEEIYAQDSHNITSNAVANEGSSGYAEFLDPDEVSVPSVSAPLCPSYLGQKIQLMHKDAPLQLYCAKLRLPFGVDTNYQQMAIVLNASSSLCRVLEACDSLAKKTFADSGSSSTWKPVVTRKGIYTTIRLKIPTISDAASGNNSVYATEMHHVNSAGASRRLVFNEFDATQLDPFFQSGALIDTFFSLEVYDYQQYAGIRLVAKRLIIYSK